MMMLRAALQTADARQGTRESSAIQHPVKIPRQCAILVGGLGTRLGSLTADTPKPLLDCGGRPFLAWVLRELVRFGVNEVVLLAGHRSERVESFCRELPAWLPKPLSVKISVEPSPAGTGGALWHARHLLRDTFLLINGDSWFDTNLARFFAASSAQDAVASVLLREMEDCARYGTAEIEGDRVVAFREKASDSASSAAAFMSSTSACSHCSRRSAPSKPIFFPLW
jgi:D-glycero-D-manno-heptose 1,7-bisphosphate phosphatase